MQPTSNVQPAQSGHSTQTRKQDMSISPRVLSTALAVLLSAIGCASIKSTFVDRDPSDTTWAQSSETMNGIPVTLAVPSHVKVQFVKRYHYTTAGTALQTATADNKQVPLVTYDFTHEVIQQKKVVLVDFKRPAAGTFEFSGSIDKDTGYFTQIAHKGEDTTIATVGAQV